MWRAVEIVGELEVGMHVHRALGPAGRARGVEPEADVVLPWSAPCRPRGWPARSGPRSRGGRWACSPETTTSCEVGMGFDEAFELRVERLRHHQRPGPAVRQHEAIVVLGHQRVDRNRNDAGLDRAEKRGRPIDGVDAGTGGCAPRGGPRARAAPGRSAPPGRPAGRSSSCRADPHRRACGRGRPADCVPANRRRNCICGGTPSAGTAGASGPGTIVIALPPHLKPPIMGMATRRRNIGAIVAAGRPTFHGVGEHGPQ